MNFTFKPSQMEDNFCSVVKIHFRAHQSEDNIIDRTELIKISATALLILCPLTWGLIVNKLFGILEKRRHRRSH